MATNWGEDLYALYKGDEFIAQGTVEEISQCTGKEINTLRYMTYPCYKERRKNSMNTLTMVLLEDD